MGTGVHSPRAKRPGREADHSPPDTAEVTNERNYIHFPLMPSWLVPRKTLCFYLLRKVQIIKTHALNFLIHCHYVQALSFVSDFRTPSFRRIQVPRGVTFDPGHVGTTIVQSTTNVDIVWTVYHLVIYTQSNKIHKVF